MDYQPLLDRFKADLMTLRRKITELAQGERPTAKFADNADTIEGQGVTAIRTMLAGPLAEHIAADNPHQDGPGGIDIYSKTAIDTALNNLFSTGILPLTRFGSAGYLPVGIGGSFESGTHIGSPGFMNTPVIMEDDGTLVYLRNATDGASRGVYYGYLANARSAALDSVTLTNRRYRPSFIPAGKEVLQVYRGNKDAIIGMVADVGTTNNQQLFIALTSGTFDDTKHVGAVLSSTLYPVDSLTRHLAAEPVLGRDGYLYFILAFNGAVAVVPSTPFTMKVFRMSVAELQAGNVTAWPELNSGWNCTGIKSSKTGQAQITLADMVASTVTTDDAAVIYPAGVGIVPNIYPAYGNGAMVQCARDPASNKIRVHIVGLIRLFPNASAFYTTPFVFSLVIDPVALTAVVDTTFRGGTTVGLDASNNFTFSNANWRAAGAPWVTSTSNMYSGHNQVITEDGYAFVFSVANSTEQTNSLYRAKVNNFTTPYALISDAGATGVNAGYQWITSKGPGPVMNGIRALNVLPGGYFNLISKGDGSYRPSIVKYRDTGENPTTVYKSVTGADMVGFSPKSDRRYVSDVSGAVQPSPLLTELGTDLSVSACRAILSTSRLSAALNWDQNLASSGTISVTAAALTAIAQAIWTAEGFAGAPKSSWTQLIIPANTNLPPVAVSWMIGTDGTTYMFVYRITVQARSGAVGTLGLVAKIGSITGPIGTATAVTPLEDGIAWGSQVCQTANGYIYTIGGQVAWPKSTGGYFQQMVFWMNLDLSTEGFRWFEILRSSSLGYVCLPGYGPGLLSNDGTDSDYITKVMFQPWGTAKANVVTPPADSRAAKIVALSQQVPGGFNVYFTEDTPLFISGKQYTLPQQAIDLRTVTATPASKKFFVYAQLKQGKPVYVIRETELAESDTNVYIGYIQTDTLGISSIVVSKVDRIDNYRLSTTPIGSAIPVSSGNPATPAQVTW